MHQRHLHLIGGHGPLDAGAGLPFAADLYLWLDLALFPVVLVVFLIVAATLHHRSRVLGSK